MNAVSRIAQFFVTTPAGRFLAAFVFVYAATWWGIEAAFGPPGMSTEYLELYKADHERYLEIVKSDDYKNYAEQRMWGTAPTDLGDDAALADKVIFATEYESREEYIAEQRRRARYDNLFDIFKIAMFVALVARFGRKPLAALLDGAIDAVRARIENAEAAAAAAARRKEEAENKIAGLEEERTRIEAAAQERIAQEQQRIEALTEHGLRQLEAETEDRKRQERRSAERALKEALVDACVDRLVEQYQAQRTPAQESALIDRFIAQLDELK